MMMMMVIWGKGRHFGFFFEYIGMIPMALVPFFKILRSALYIFDAVMGCFLWMRFSRARL